MKGLFGIQPEEPVLTTITGTWSGYYEQHDTRSRIAAKIVQDGTTIRGHMRDIDTCTTKSLFDALAQEGHPPGADEALDRQIRSMLPNAGRDPIVVRTVLPTDAILEGELNGEFIRFTKTYLGESSHAYEIGDVGIECKSPGHAVEYSGRVSRDLKTIVGHWTIYGQDTPRGFIEGHFELRRDVPTGRS